MFGSIRCQGWGSRKMKQAGSSLTAIGFQFARGGECGGAPDGTSTSDLISAPSAGVPSTGERALSSPVGVPGKVPWFMWAGLGPKLLLARFGYRGLACLSSGQYACFEPTAIVHDDYGKPNLGLPPFLSSW